jgi:hypothetical protein
MDASKITELRQKQANKYINRAQTVDASTLTWKRQIESSKYVATQAPVLNGAGCQTCGPNSTVSTSTQGVGPNAFYIDGTNTIYVVPPLNYPNPMFSAKGSAGSYVSCEQIAYMRAGQNSCGVAPLSFGNLVQTLPSCFCGDGDIYYQPNNQGGSNLIVPSGADVCGNWLNPYLPIPQPYIGLTQPQPFESYYKVNVDPSQNNYQTATIVREGPLVSTLQNGKVVYSSVAPNLVFIPNNDGTGRGTLVQDGFTAPRATDPRSLP